MKKNSNKTRTKLTNEQLVQLAQSGDKIAYEQLIKDNQRMIKNVIKRHFQKWLDRPAMSQEDLIQEGNLGIMRAIEKFDITKGRWFSSYATQWVWCYIGRYVNKSFFESISLEQLLESDSIVDIWDYFQDAKENQKGLQLLIDHERQSTLDKILRNTLNHRELQILKMRFGIEPYEKTYILAEIGEYYHISRERVRQIIQIAANKINQKKDKELKQWMY